MLEAKKIKSDQIPRSSRIEKKYTVFSILVYLSLRIQTKPKIRTLTIKCNPYSDNITIIKKVILNYSPLRINMRRFFIWGYNYNIIFIHHHFMNIKEYREFKINKYPDSKTGLLMYRHEKLYDIVTTIEQFVNISFSSNAIDQEKYIEQYNNLIKDLPKEYNRKYGNIFNRFIKKYNNANNIEKKYNSNFRKKLKKIMGINNLTKELSHYLHIKNIDINNILLKRY
jgi:hypothetical protein